jgi:hypothetical protein
MALLEVSVDQGDKAKLDALIQHIRVQLSPRGLADLMRADIFREMRERVQDRFAAEGDTTVGAWSPLSTATENIRSSMGFPPDHPINERTGLLRGWVERSHVVTPMATGAELQMPGPFPSALMETKFRRAQQGKAKGGSKEAKRTMPARPVLAIGNVEKDLVDQRMMLFVDRVLRGR